MRLALFQPDIPQNVGAAVRLCACLGVELAIIEPCGFPLTAQALRRTAMDYGENLVIQRHDSWATFHRHHQDQGGQLVLFTTRGAQIFTDFAFHPTDTLLFGRESAGVPDDVHNAADARLIIPLASGARSLNLVSAGSIACAEALRQTGGFPKLARTE